MAISYTSSKDVAVLEEKIAEGLVQPDELIFTWLGSNPGTYRRLLPRVFKIAVVIFLVLAIAAAIHVPGYDAVAPGTSNKRQTLSAANTTWPPSGQRIT